MSRRITGVATLSASAVNHRAALPLRRGGLLAALAGMLILAGCAASSRGEEVYLMQHRASIALTQAVMAAEYDNPEIVDQLYDGEEALGRACGALQTIGYRKMNQGSVDPALKLAAYDSLDSCAAEAVAVEELLWRLDPETAGYYFEAPVISAMVVE